MNEDIFAGQWKQMRGDLKSWWGKLADDELDLIGGHKDKLIGLVQERYGYARDQAEHEVERGSPKRTKPGCIRDLAPEAFQCGPCAIGPALSEAIGQDRAVHCAG